MSIDAGLVGALRRDEPDALPQLVERYGEGVYRLALRITGVQEDAENATADVLSAAAREIHTFTGTSSFPSWIRRLTAGVAYQTLRARRQAGDEIALDSVLPALDGDGLHFEAMDDWSKRVAEPAHQGELRRALTDAIDALPADYRTALVLRDVEGLSDRDIAETLGVGPGAIKSLVHRSRLFVRKRLSEGLT